MPHTKKLASLKGQRTRLKKSIENLIQEAQSLLGRHGETDQKDDRALEIESTKVFLQNLMNKYENLTNNIAEEAGSENETEDFYTDDGDASMELIIRATKTVPKLEVASKGIAAGSGNIRPDSESNGNQSDIIESHLNKLLEIEALKIQHASQSSTKGNFGHKYNVRLPKLEFKKFAGDVIGWTEFWDSFEASVDSNDCLQPVEKLGYLRSKLEDEALHTIAGLQTTNDNYGDAVQLLKGRYGNLQLLINAHYVKMMELSPIPNHTAKLRFLFDEVEKHLRSLSALGEDISHRQFISMIMAKLPHPVVTKLEEMKDPEELWTVDLLRKKLQCHLSARETADYQFNSHGSSSHARIRSDATSLSSRHSTGEALAAYHREDHRKPERRACVFCSGSHWNDECGVFKTVEARKQAMHGRCFICLSDTHLLKNCPKSDKPCYHCRRRKHHHSSLCPVKFARRNEATAVASECTSCDTDSNNVQCCDEALVALGERVVLQTALGILDAKGATRPVRTRILFDCGSSRSYIGQRLAKQLNIVGHTEALSLVTFGSEKSKTVQSQSAEVFLDLNDGTTKNLAINIVPKITGTISRSPVNFHCRSFLWKDLPMADTLPKEKELTDIDCLIGCDYYMELMTSEKIMVQDGLYLIGSKLGWILTGRTTETDDDYSNVSMFVSGAINQSVQQLHQHRTIDPCVPVNPSFEDFWSLESIGVQENLQRTDDERAQEMFDNTVEFEHGRFQVTFPWKEEFPSLPDNYQLALGRFKTNWRRISKNEDLLQKYNTIIQDQANKGVIEQVNETNDDPTTRKHYIPHHPVITPMKTTTKVRIVYDASAKTTASMPSLNECLLRGPVILQDLVGLLIRFRLFKIVILADIEKAFLQVGLQPQERDVTRFIWLKDLNRATMNDNLQIYRFCRVPFGIISSPFLLGATIIHHLRKSNTAAAHKMKKSLYVDNVITGTDSPEEAQEFYKEAKQLLNDASMNLREWSSNSMDFLATIPDEDKVKQPHIKVLGLHWDIPSDVISIPGQAADRIDSASTKRDVMQVMAMNFDPLGLLTPATLKTKLYVQNLWTHKAEWDDRLTDQQMEEWKQIAADIKWLPSIKVARHIPSNEFKCPGLLCFCDASAKAYSTAVYLRWRNGSRFETQLLFSKTRLSPSKKLSLPRLELMAVLIGVRSIQFVNSQLDFTVHEKILWSDSQCALYWIKSTKLLSVFVENRVKEIRRHDDIKFRYVSTHENPAAIATRGESAVHLSGDLLWWNGPPWLSCDSRHWPSWKFEEITKTELTAAQQEAKGSKVFFEVGLVSSNTLCGIDQTNFSSLTKLLRVTAWILRFLRNVGAKFKQLGFLKYIKESGKVLVAKELFLAKTMWERFIQEANFNEAIQSIKNGKKHNLVQQLRLTIDASGVLRCQGRLQIINPPKLLPRRCHFTRLTIEAIHKRLLHSGVSHTLSQLRNEYWIPQGRAEVRKVLVCCLVCRKHSGGPFRPPLMPPLPVFRTSRSSPFSYVGIDYFGPVWIKNNLHHQYKVWVCLFTCLCVRAIHLEIVENLSTDQFLMCLRRFIARRGTPTQIISDNAPHFKAADNVLKSLFKRLVEDTSMREFASDKGIDWKFIVEFAPWMGGVYERLVGIVKNALKKSVGKLCLYSSQMQTILYEVEAIVNSRPITFTGTDIDSGFVLTPACFLCLNPRGIIPGTEQGVDDDDSSYCSKFNSTDALIQNWNKGHRLLQTFWKSWEQEYLQTLRERKETHLKGPRVTSKSLPRVGQIVLVKNEKKSSSNVAPWNDTTAHNQPRRNSSSSEGENLGKQQSHLSISATSISSGV